MNIKKTVIIMSAVLLGGTACVPTAPPGSVSAVQSGFDNQRYARAEPGWVANIGDDSVGLLGGPFKLGAQVHSEAGAFLIVRIDEIVSISALEVRVGDEIYTLKEAGRTDIETSFDNPADIKNSERGFHIDRSVLERMVSGETTLVRVTTSGGYLEGNFSATCASRWPDRACVGVRKMLKEATRTVP